MCGKRMAGVTVLKFGGASLANGAAIERCAAIVKRQKHTGQRPVVVLSAMGSTTDLLLEAMERAQRGDDADLAEAVAALTRRSMQELDLAVPEVEALLLELTTVLRGLSLLRELTPRIRDLIASFGERLSVRVFAAYLRKIDMQAQAFDAWEVGFQTSAGAGAEHSSRSSAQVLPATYPALRKSLGDIADSGPTPVITGYIAKDPQGKVTTLGRDGSDLTAAVVGAALHAQEVQIWKEVDGVLSADPRLEPTAKPVPVLTFEEASELAYFGAKCVHPNALQPCRDAGIPIVVKSVRDPDGGTRVLPSAAAQEYRRTASRHNEGDESLALAVSVKQPVSLLDISSTRMLGQAGFLSKVFSLFDQYGVSVDVIATSEVSISTTLDPHYRAEDLEHLVDALSEVGTVDLVQDLALITVVTANPSNKVLHTVIGTCVNAGIEIELVSHGASKVNMSFLVSQSRAGECLRALHAALCVPPSRSGATTPTLPISSESVKLSTA